MALTQGVPNPSFVKDEDSTDWVRMEDGREYELHHHTMLKPLVIGPELLVELTSDAAAPATATAVRDGPVGAPAKRAKQLLPCQFGAECYRTNNAEHSAKYSHPHVNDLNQNRATAQLAVDAAAIGADATAPRPTSAAAAAAGAAAVARAAPPPVGGEQPVRGADGGAKGGGGGGWSNALLPFCQRPEAHPDEVVRHTATAVAIRDKYPKARVHFLVMPRARIDNFAALTAAHLPLLRELHEMGLALAAESGVKCRLGYHMRPSMTQIHLHVISDDMDSACLKNKKVSAATAAADSGGISRTHSIGTRFARSSSCRPPWSWACSRTRAASGSIRKRPPTCSPWTCDVTDASSRSPTCLRSRHTC